MINTIASFPACIRRQKYLIALLMTVFLFGCTATEPKRLESDFGKSVTSMISGQILNPETIHSPSSLPPTGADAERAANVLEAYQQDIAKPKQVEKPVVVRIGN